MGRLMSLVQGSECASVRLLWLLGLAGGILALTSRLFPCHAFAMRTGEPLLVYSDGHELLGMIAAVVFLALLMLRSVYAIVPALAFMLYALEHLVGGHLLRYMPFDVTRLLAGLYLMLPMASVLMLLGAVATLMHARSRVQAAVGLSGAAPP